MRTIPNIKNQLKQLDDVIRTEFIPAITEGINFSDIGRRFNVPASKVWNPRNSNIFRACTEGIRVLDHTII